MKQQVRQDLQSSQNQFGNEFNNQLDDKAKHNQGKKCIPNIFRFADKQDIVFIILGIIGSCASGVQYIIFNLIQGSAINSFSLPPDQIVSSMVDKFILFIIVASIQIVGGSIMYFGWIISGYRQAQKCRAEYLKAIFKQQIGWFQTQDQNKIYTQFRSDCNTYQETMSQKMAVLVLLIAAFITRVIVSLIIFWQLCLVLLAGVIVIIIVFLLASKLENSSQEDVLKQTIKAVSRTEEVISSIETVKALNGQAFQHKKYENFLKLIKSKEFKLAISAGISSSIMFFVIYCLFAVGFLYGLYLVSIGTSYFGTGFYTVGDVFVVVMNIGIGVFTTLQFRTTLRKMKQGIKAFRRIQKVVDRNKQHNQQEQGIIPEQFVGHIVLKNVSFAYPSNPGKQVLQNVNIDFKCQSHALVGFSGSGKSTIFQLIIRLYDPDSGSILLDGKDIKQINTKWLRKQIGYITQQVFLFTGTIRQNFLFANPEATDEDIKDALKAAQVYDMVHALQQKLDTKITSNGNQFSGGQRQRLSIAKTLLRKPKLVLLDQPTSSLDRKTETLILRNLQKLFLNVKTITIAHRISTIKKCDHIVFMKDGKVVEQGKFAELASFHQQVSLKRRTSQQLRQSTNLFQSLRLSKKLSSKIQLVKAQQSDQEEQSRQLQQSEILVDEEKKQIKQGHQAYTGPIYSRTLMFSQTKLPALIIAIILSVFIGVPPPFVGRNMGFLIVAGIEQKGETLLQTTKRQALFIFILAIAFFILKLFETFLFKLAASEITYQIRKKLYQKILKMPISWFYQSKGHSVSELSKVIDNQCGLIQNLITVSIGIIIEAIVVCITALVISFLFQWRVSFVMLGLIPSTVIIGLIQVRVNGKFSKQMEQKNEDSNSLLRESMINAKIIFSNCFEQPLVRKYEQIIMGPLNVIIKKGLITGFLFGLSLFFLSAVVGAQYIVMGAVLVSDPNVELTNVIVPMFSMNICFIFVSYLFHFMPDIGNSKKSAASVFFILDQQDQQQKQVRQNQELVSLNPVQFKQIRFQNVSFKYPNSNQYTLQNANLVIQKGAQYNIIGRSGCGKSTLFKLLLRFYEPSEGSQITINGVNIKKYQIHSLRSLFGVISQQPILFAGTIRENIEYNSQGTSMLNIRQAANQSNALQFIKSEQGSMISKDVTKNGFVKLIYNRKDYKSNQKISQNRFQQSKQGFQREVGVKGNKLSGGQRQRISIARTLLRNPVFFLFDQATSALDQQTQKIVERNLKQILKGKTSLNITHNYDQAQNKQKKVIIIENRKIIVCSEYQDL